ncbi:ribonuclease PH [Canibacter sp. lx-72]|uniref:ribonuclease PH n=1 Tax=Canibacter zhuwentaonis TaxID=2837491 RepID=UPI001BDD0036|nr:ribonuclease PH [Canibacter zhuwentaonis]MBT1017763.1 ribonuclease PH [Canibacter zhuwentaonis]MBT1034918.1 ribonuclease PH [Canibacter zhuwentaonis]
MAENTVMRAAGRALHEMREVKIERGWSTQAEGSCLISYGNTRVLCTASFIAGVPRWRANSKQGWVTAEYAMLPRATSERMPRESVKGKIGGRTHEISRLVARSLRAVVDLSALGENTITVDCDVLQADGGTRTAAITGAFVALADAVECAKGEKLVRKNATVIKDSVAAVSVGIVDGVVMVDLTYAEDSAAFTDMNVVITGSGELVEVQGTAEREPFTRAQLHKMLDLAESAVVSVREAQLRALEG